MSASVAPRRAGILPPYLLDHVARAAPEHARHCAQLSRHITAFLRQQRARGLLARAEALVADAAPATHAVQRRIYDAQHGTALPGTLVRDEGAAATDDVAVTEAYDSLGATHDFFQTVYGHNSIDDAGMPLIGSVHYERGYDNAFWDGEQMVLGKDPQPATMAGYVNTQEDDGGVHYNSGIPNHAFYRAAVAIGGAAWETTGRIWYRTLTGGELAAGADFATFAARTVSVASADYGPTSVKTLAVQQAWRDVGVLA
ncbi:peptidase M4 family protein [Xanthomonas hortorum pv. gardneri]|uniref:M4 family metallopeptidase n=1 Tax=Xanthomonas hortorum TaxID=56454 RepID=UPI003F817746